MDNYLLLALVLWPAIAVGSALINMLIWWTFSWTELAMAYATGVVAGSVAHAMIDDPTSTAARWLAVCTQGPVGILKVTGSLSNPENYFWAAAGIVCGSTLLAAALDRAAVALGSTMTVGSVLLSLLIFPLKVLAAPLTSAAGLLIFLAGLCRLPFADASRVGFLGGILYVEWYRNTTTKGEWTTTVGCTVHCWINRFSGVMGHELYHTRQCIYMHDLMIPAWVVGEALRLALSGSTSQNPIERAAYGVK